MMRSRHDQLLRQSVLEINASLARLGKPPLDLPGLLGLARQWEEGLWTGTELADALRDAHAVFIDSSSLLLDFPREPEDTILRFEWIHEGQFFCSLIPGCNLQSAVVTAEGFLVEDDAGAPVVITPIRLH